MAEPAPPSIQEITAFARRHGLDNLSPAQLTRMAELAVYVGELGRTLPRPPAKDDLPAPTFDVSARREKQV